jgi:hypothetical protein
MSVEEARSVMWLKTNHRPLGELLDEGFLNERRLTWAAERAYNPRLKEAAGVLLAWLREQKTSPGQPPAESDAASQRESLTAIKADITIEEARATLWPFRPYANQPMGELVDTQRLNLKDLGYAVENAWDRRVRQSAAILMALRLNQAVEEPASPGEPLQVVSGGRSYAERRQVALTLIQGLVLGGAIGLFLGLGIPDAIQWITTPSSRPSLTDVFASPAHILGAIIALVLGIGTVWLSNFLPKTAVKKLEQRIDTYRKGQEGEDQVVAVMRRNLDSEWTLFRNVCLPGRNTSDIDGVLVGPSGVWALEIKSYTGDYRSYGELWEYRAGNQWKSLDKSPSRQARDNAIRLADFFRADGIRKWVEPAVIWANSEGTLSVENPTVAVWTFEQLPDELGNLQRERKMEEETQSDIVEKLSSLCQHQREKDAEVWS